MMQNVTNKNYVLKMRQHWRLHSKLIVWGPLSWMVLNHLITPHGNTGLIFRPNIYTLVKCHWLSNSRESHHSFIIIPWNIAFPGNIKLSTSPVSYWHEFSLNNCNNYSFNFIIPPWQALCSGTVMWRAYSSQTKETGLMNLQFHLSA